MDAEVSISHELFPGESTIDFSKFVAGRWEKRALKPAGAYSGELMTLQAQRSIDKPRIEDLRPNPYPVWWGWPTNQRRAVATA